MKILLAQPRGCCAGVEMAIKTLDAALLRFGSPLYAYHEIVHNRHIVAHFEERGVVFIDDLDPVPPGARVVISAHGVSPHVREEAARRGLHVIDATCPLVDKVHREARRFRESADTILLIGHRGHDEVDGVLGEAPEHIVVVENAAEAARVDVRNADRVALLTQTTWSVDEARSTVEVLESRFPLIARAPSSDICYATQNRQEAVRMIAAEADVVLVIGSANSANTQRLVELARNCGRPAYRVDSADELKPEWLPPQGTVMVTAGASVPETLIQRVIDGIARLCDVTVEERVWKEERIHFPLPSLDS
ncbi:MAG: 4-hydroxy-3-methylbut-2-enyl diphosphate reductase [Bryobacteraceae bacterium]